MTENKWHIYPELKTAWEQDQRLKEGRHLHRKGERGASGAYDCPVHTACKVCGISLPKKEGIVRTNVGPFVVGDIIHKYCQTMMRKSWIQKHPEHGEDIFVDEIMIATVVTTKTDNEILSEVVVKYPEAQVYLETQIEMIEPESTISDPDWDDPFCWKGKIKVNPCFMDLLFDHPEWITNLGYHIMISPIDIAHVTGYYLRPVYFKDEVHYYPVISHFKFLYIGDIKSADDYGFWKMKKEGAGEKYIAQFHAYMKGAKMDVITTLCLHKAKLYEFEEVIPWDAAFWQKVIDRQFVTDKMEETFRGRTYDQLFQASVPLPACACACDKDTIAWWGCELAQTKEEIDPESGEPSLKLVHTCQFAEEHFGRQVNEKFIIKDAQWNYGRSIITVNKIEEGFVYATNKSGTEFEINFFDAMKKIVPNIPKSPKVKKI